MAATEPSVEEIISELPGEKQTVMKRLLFGNPTQQLDVPEAAAKLAASGNFEVRLWKTACPAMQTRPARLVRIGVIQNAVVEPTTAPIEKQYRAIEARVEQLIDAAAAMGCNVACLQEAWTAPFFFCTREKQPWLEFAQPAESGAVFDFIARKAKQHNMVIVSPILERDPQHQGQIWNTAVIISNNGTLLGKHRKNHIPRVGDFNESTYYMEGDTGHPVYETAFGKVAINICYGRHHPLNWMMFGLNGAEIVFNPSATIGALSEPLWSIEARNASIANSYFVGAINRVGTEHFPNEFTSADGKPAHKDFGHFYGSSYVANPDGSRTPGLPRSRDGVLVNEVDLNMCEQVKDRWMFQHTARYDMYAKGLARYVRHDFKPQVVPDPAMRGRRSKL
jgi:beta-ureidopropionase